MPALLAALIALALVVPADAARRKPRTVCVSYAEPGVNPRAITCAQRVR